LIDGVEPGDEIADEEPRDETEKKADEEHKRRWVAGSELAVPGGKESRECAWSGFGRLLK
jgi:hypothetical protein